jgi:hypothetical protein
MSTYDIKPGDIIGFSGFNMLSAGINIATYGIPLWSVSHVGIVAEVKVGGRLLLFESTTLNGDYPCLVTGEKICGTQAHSPEFIVGQYKGGAWHYPLYRELYAHERVRLTSYLNESIGTQYDVKGALRAGGLAFAFLEALFREQSAQTLFCSEWVAASLQNIGILQTANFSGWSPNYLCRYMRRHGVLNRPRRLPILPNYEQYERFTT